MENSLSLASAIIPMTEETKLSRAQWERLNDQFQRTPDPDEGSSAPGEHYMPNYILNQLGYHPTSRREAIKIAERLLSSGWIEDN
jgi:hypothetical protein